MSIASLERQLINAELDADDPDISKPERRRRLAKVERLRVQIAKFEAREERRAEERGQRASRRSWI